MVLNPIFKNTGLLRGNKTKIGIVLSVFPDCIGNLKSHISRGFGIQGVLFNRSGSSYRAAVVRKFGEPLEITKVDRNELKENDVRIDVYCCGINSVDQYNILGKSEPKVDLPFVPGFEVCGEVLEVGEDVKKLKKGQRVIGLNPEQKNGFADEIVIPSTDVWPVNNALNFSQGASLINSYTTALLALTKVAKIKETDTVLVIGAAGRIGLAAADLAANVYRCKVIAVCTSSDKADALREVGAYATITVGKQDISDQVSSVMEGEGVSIVIDTVGTKEIMKELVKSVGDNSKIIIAGSASLDMPKVDSDALEDKACSVHASSLEYFRKKDYKTYYNGVLDVIEMCNEGLIKPYVPKHLPLDNVNDALKEFEDKKSVIKVVLDMK